MQYIYGFTYPNSLMQQMDGHLPWSVSVPVWVRYTSMATINTFSIGILFQAVFLWCDMIDNCMAPYLIWNIVPTLVLLSKSKQSFSLAALLELLFSCLLKNFHISVPPTSYSISTETWVLFDVNCNFFVWFLLHEFSYEPRKPFFILTVLQWNCLKWNYGVHAKLKRRNYIYTKLTISSKFICNNAHGHSVA